ncbi:hypothetical protein MG293_011277 [Ovis ammon polii]|uniref:Uncharacterized protein n=1 Tax=Ovis ammon polii TaxID=230172 RepID=A0AAD4U7K9_OVIAM|nr:hypothetical protein MG293_011277 [Ovis ammon polii]
MNEPEAPVLTLAQRTQVGTQDELRIRKHVSCADSSQLCPYDMQTVSQGCSCYAQLQKTAPMSVFQSSPAQPRSPHLVDAESDTTVLLDDTARHLRDPTQDYTPANHALQTCRGWGRAEGVRSFIQRIVCQ